MADPEIDGAQGGDVVWIGAQAGTGLDLDTGAGQGHESPRVARPFREHALPLDVIDDQVADGTLAAMDEGVHGECAERPAAPGAVAVGRDHEAVVIADRSAPVCQIPYAVRLRCDHLAGGVEPRRPGEVYAVAQPVDHVEAVARHVAVQQPLPRAPGDDPVEADRRPLQPVAQIRARDEQTAKRVGKPVKIDDVAHLQRAGRDVGEILRPAQPASLEGRRCRQHRQVGIGGLPQRVLEGRALRVVGDLGGKPVAYQRQVAVDRLRRAGEDAVGQLDRVCMGATQRPDEAQAGRDPFGRMQPGVMRRDLPASLATSQVDVELAKVRATEARQHAGHVAQRTAIVIGAGNGGMIGPRKGAVTVPGDDRVDAGDLRERARRVLLHPLLWPRRIRVGADAGMGQRDHQVRALGADHRDPGPRAVEHVARRQPVGQMGAVPCGDLWRGQPDQSDAQGVGRTGGVAHPAGQDDVGRHECCVLERRDAAPRDRVGAGQGKLGLAQRAAQPVETEIELVIAERGGVVAHLVHRPQHRVLPTPSLTGLRCQIAERGALQEIAIVEQKTVLVTGLDAGAAHKRGDPGQTVGAVFGIGEVVEGQDMAMHVRGCENTQVKGRRADIAGLGTRYGIGQNRALVY
ncbi:hypothetical protein V8324_06875 [Roseovarius sp. D22-M7]